MAPKPKLTPRRKPIRRKSIGTKNKSASGGEASTAAPSSPLPLNVHRDDALAWLKGAPYPANWDKFASREIVCERRFLYADIFRKSKLHDERGLTVEALRIFEEEKRFGDYTNPHDPGYASLTRLFFASLHCPSDVNIIHGNIGSFKFSFTMHDVVDLFVKEPSFHAKTSDILSDAFVDTMPSSAELLKTLFIVPNKKPHALINFVHYLYFMVIYSNILPSKGNKTEMTRRMIELVWIMETLTPSLSEIIFYNIKAVARHKKAVVLPYPCFVTSLLKEKGYVFPEIHEAPLHLDIVTPLTWDRCLSAGSETRMAAFDERGWKYTVGLVVNGKVLPDANPDSSLKKRKAVSQPESSTSPSSDAMARLESSIATLTSAVTTMNLSIHRTLAELNSKVDALQGEVVGLRSDMAILKPIVLGFADLDPVVVSDEDDEDDDVDDDLSLFHNRDASCKNVRTVPDDILPTANIESTLELNTAKSDEIPKDVRTVPDDILPTANI